jgi:ABC-type glycerol-3-phosphate transport system permease component
MAASVVTILPVVVLFLFTQKTFVPGIATTGTKL